MPQLCNNESIGRFISLSPTLKRIPPFDTMKKSAIRVWLGIALSVRLVLSLSNFAELDNSNTRHSRRSFLGTTGGLALSTAAANFGIKPSDASGSIASNKNLPYTTDPEAGQFYFPALTPPFSNRATFLYSLGRDAWALEQLLTFANVTATIRCNVIKLKETGGLWVHSPQWPTGEFCSLLDSIGAPVEHVVLPCNAFEHKAPMQAFTKKYPRAKVWISPGQFGPLGSCGQTLSKCNMGYRVDGILGPGNPLPPWANEFDMSTLYVEIPKNAGPVSEVSFCHRPTKTLVATDSVLYAPGGDAPDIFATYFDRTKTMTDPTFWPRTVLQAVFLPLRTDGDGNYPGYDAIKDRLVRAPILRALVDSRAPEAVREWIQEQTTGWEFDRILTSHFASPIKAGPADVRAAFDYLFAEEQLDPNLPPIACKDWELLNGINKFVADSNAGAPVTFDFQRGCVEL
eukprot:scaffold338_cov116-Cylindrotheca_fusiformis.AAC.6